MAISAALTPVTFVPFYVLGTNVLTSTHARDQQVRLCVELPASSAA